MYISFTNYAFSINLRIFAPMLVKTRAIVLHTIKYGDDRLIVDMFTETDGKLTFVVKPSKGKNGKIRKQFFQPFSMLEIDFDLRKRQAMQQLKDVRIETPIVSIPFEPVKLTICMFLSEVLWGALRGEQENEPLFNFIHDSILLLDAIEEGIANFHLVFLIHLPYYLGFMPNMEDTSNNSLFDLRDGCFVSMTPLHKDFLSQEDSLVMLQLMRMTYRTMNLYALSRQQRNRCIEVLMVYYRLHLPEFGEPRSLAVLREIFNPHQT